MYVCICVCMYVCMYVCMCDVCATASGKRGGGVWVGYVLMFFTYGEVFCVYTLYVSMMRMTTSCKQVREVVVERCVCAYIHTYYTDILCVDARVCVFTCMCMCMCI